MLLACLFGSAALALVGALKTGRAVNAVVRAGGADRAAVRDALVSRGLAAALGLLAGGIRP